MVTIDNFMINYTATVYKKNRRVVQLNRSISI